MNTALRKRGAFLLLCGVMVARLTLDQVVAVRARPRQRLTLLTKNKIIMKKNGTKDFFEAIGFENPDDVKSMLKQIGFGIAIGMCLIAVLGLGEMCH